MWIAADSFIAPGVDVRANAVIGARSSIFSNISREQVCWGSPSPPYYSRKRFEQEEKV